LLDQAIEHYQEALKIRRELVEIDACFKPKLANVLNNLGVAYRDKGSFDRAIEHYQEALKIRRELVEIDASFKPKLANILNNLANAYYSKGLLDQAIEHYQEALKIRRELVENDFRLQFTTSLIFLGIALGTRGTEEDKVRSKKLQVEAKSMLHDSAFIESPQYPSLISLAKILDSIVGE
jgi:tetratricopeptide (TPR) repeat protein